MTKTSASSPRALRVALMALGFAVLLAAGMGGLFPPATVTAATPPSDSRSPSNADVLAQLEPGDKDPGADDPGQVLPQDSGDQDNGDDDEPDDVGTPNTTDQPPTEGKMYPVEPDSVLKAKAALPPAGGGGFDTLRAVPPGSPAAKRAGTTGSGAQRKTFLGITPAFFLVGLLAIHVFVVKSVND